MVPRSGRWTGGSREIPSTEIGRNLPWTCVASPMLGASGWINSTPTWTVIQSPDESLTLFGDGCGASPNTGR